MRGSASVSPVTGDEPLVHRSRYCANPSERIPGARRCGDDLPVDLAAREVFGRDRRTLRSNQDNDHGLDGLILVTGPTGSGKTTTLAGMIDYINENRAVNIITQEDPIEYVYTDKLAWSVSARSASTRTASRRL